MKAWVVRGEGMPWEVFRQEDFPEPTHADLSGYAVDMEGLRPLREGEVPHPDYVLIRVRAACLAWPDLTMATGEYPVPIRRPYISGQEGVGIVEDTSPSLGHMLGKRVCGFTPQPYGCFAERSVMLSHTLFEVPESFSDEEGAAFLIASHTAYHAVHRRGQVQAGETVLVLGAAGGVPSAALQLCVAAGARVIAVAGGATKAQYCRDLGAQIVIDHRGEDFAEAVRREVGRASVNVIVDFVQGEMGACARPLLAVEGRHVMAGHAGGLLPVHPHEFYMQNWSLVGCCMGAGYGEQLPEIEAQAHAHILSLVEAGRYRPAPSRVIGFEEIPETLRAFVSREVVGRVVARIA